MLSLLDGYNCNDKICGIYCIENLYTNEKYIGQSINIYKRLQGHINDLKKGTKSNSALQKAWIDFGESGFIAYILIESIKDIKLLNKLEKFFIKYYKSHISESGYNIDLGGNSFNTGKRMSEPIKNARSIAMKEGNSWNKGIPRTEDEKRKISHGNKGKIRTLETRKKLSKSKKNHTNKLKGTKWSKERSENFGPTQQGIKKFKNSSSKFVGVYYNPRNRKWILTFRSKCIGGFETEIDAAFAYNKLALEFYGENARINYISEHEIEENQEYKNNTFRLIGIYKDNTNQTFYGRIQKHKKIYNLGHYKSLNELVEIYNKKLIELLGEFAILNRIPINFKEDKFESINF